MDLVCNLVAVGGRPVLHVQGEIDLATLPGFRDQLIHAIGESVGNTLSVDLDGVTALDDTGLGMLLGAAGRARELGGDLVVVCSSARLLQRFDLTGFARAVTIVANLHD